MKKLLGLLATASLVAGGALAATAGPAAAGTTSGELFIDVEKEVVGPEPSGDFEVEVDCEAPGYQFEIDNDEFDLNGDGDSDDVVVTFDAGGIITCTVEESDDQGATSVTYECDAGVVSSPPGARAECEDDESDDPAEIEIDTSSLETYCPGLCLEFDADVTIINTFEAGTTTTVAPTTAAPPTSAAAAAVAARARFTG